MFSLLVVYALGVPAPPSEGSSACLCIFDIDRTIMAKQDGIGCSGVDVIHEVHDTAYGGGPLTLSALALRLSEGDSDLKILYKGYSFITYQY